MIPPSRTHATGREVPPPAGTATEDLYAFRSYGATGSGA